MMKVCFDTKVEVYDDGGKTMDRYTVVIDSEVYTMSSNPLSPQGVNQWAGKIWEFDRKRFGKKLKSIPKVLHEAIIDRIRPD